MRKEYDVTRTSLLWGNWIKQMSACFLINDLFKDSLSVVGKREIGWEGVDWMHLAQVSTTGNSCEHGNEPSGSIKDGEFLD
jgi:hypothetical protein